MTSPRRVEPPPRALVIHPGALGDVLQAVPAVRGLRAPGQRWAVAFAGAPRLGRLLVGLGVVDAAIGFDGLGLEALFVAGPPPPTLRDRLGGLARVVSWFGARADGYAERLRSLVADSVIAPPVPADGARPVWAHLVASLARWNVSPVCEPLAPPAAWREAAGEALARAGADLERPILLVQPGAGGPAKRWPAARFAAVLERAAAIWQVVLHQGPADAEAVRALETQLTRPWSRLVEPDIETLAGLLARVDAYLGADSGVSHLAASVGTPAVILHPERTRGAWAPWSPTARLVTWGDDDVDEAAHALTGFGAAPRLPINRWPGAPSGLRHASLGPEETPGPRRRRRS